METLLMPKKKRAGPGRPKSEKGRRKLIFQMKGDEAWKDWFDGFAKREGVSGAELVEEAMRVYARLHKYDDPPKRVTS